MSTLKSFYGTNFDPKTLIEFLEANPNGVTIKIDEKCGSGMGPTWPEYFASISFGPSEDQIQSASLESPVQFLNFLIAEKK